MRTHNRRSFDTRIRALLDSGVHERKMESSTRSFHTKRIPVSRGVGLKRQELKRIKKNSPAGLQTLKMIFPRGLEPTDRDREISNKSEAVAGKT